MRKHDNMVSLNPEYGIEVTTLAQLADMVKDDNPELYNILTILVASILDSDEKTLVKHFNKYLEERIVCDQLKKSINDMIDGHSGDPDDDKGWDLFSC
jgi:hypothetical protein|tara:strand:- start:8074 stop:8367 length:294 start_codon:yes stop_codon:yes gene_type:complete